MQIGAAKHNDELNILMVVDGLQLPKLIAVATLSSATGRFTLPSESSLNPHHQPVPLDKHFIDPIRSQRFVFCTTPFHVVLHQLIVLEPGNHTYSD